MFLFLHTISDKTFHNLQECYRENGLTPRQHGNTRRLIAYTVSFGDTQRVVEFLHTVGIIKRFPFRFVYRFVLLPFLRAAFKVLSFSVTIPYTVSTLLY